MKAEKDTTSASPEQIDELLELIAQARSKGVRTGIRNDEVQDLDRDAAAELIEQLRRRLGETAG